MTIVPVPNYHSNETKILFGLSVCHHVLRCLLTVLWIQSKVKASEPSPHKYPLIRLSKTSVQIYSDCAARMKPVIAAASCKSEISERNTPYWKRLKYWRNKKRQLHSINILRHLSCMCFALTLPQCRIRTQLEANILLQYINLTNSEALWYTSYRSEARDSGLQTILWDLLPSWL